MKKYVKPELFYESFELSQHIAACGIHMGFKGVEDCKDHSHLNSDLWGGLEFHVFDDSTCEIATNTIEAYCYTVGTMEAGRTFNS